MMPKGVEHRLCAGQMGELKTLILALMPKGVEHPQRLALVRLGLKLILALMPKGVEHVGGYDRFGCRRT